jgi:hypothetical protein
LRPFGTKTEHLPRQARDKHRKTCWGTRRFSQGEEVDFNSLQVDLEERYAAMEQSEEVLEPAPDHTGGDVMGAIEEVQLAQVRVCLYSLLLLLLLPSFFYVLKYAWPLEAV